MHALRISLNNTIVLVASLFMSCAFPCLGLSYVYVANDIPCTVMQVNVYVTETYYYHGEIVDFRSWTDAYFIEYGDNLFLDDVIDDSEPPRVYELRQEVMGNPSYYPSGFDEYFEEIIYQYEGEWAPSASAFCPGEYFLQIRILYQLWRAGWRNACGQEQDVSEFWRDEPEYQTGQGTGTISLIKADNQGYPATDIFPHVCINAQPEYRRTKWRVILPSAVTATLGVEGPVTADKTSDLRNGDIVTITASGSGSGTYTLTLNACGSTSTGGTVFAFEFESMVVPDVYGPMATANGGMAIPSTFTTLAVARTPHGESGAAAIVGRTWRISLAYSNVLFMPPLTVMAHLKANATTSYHTLLWKSYKDEGTANPFTIGLSGGWFSISHNFTGDFSGNDQAGSTHRAALMLTETVGGSGNPFYYGSVGYSTAQFTAPIFPGYASFEHSGFDQGEIVDLQARSYVVGETSVYVNAVAGVGAQTTDTEVLTYCSGADTIGPQTLTVGEFDNVFTIQ